MNVLVLCYHPIAGSSRSHLYAHNFVAASALQIRLSIESILLRHRVEGAGHVLSSVRCTAGFDGKPCVVARFDLKWLADGAHSDLRHHEGGIVELAGGDISSPRHREPDLATRLAERRLL